MLKLHLNGPGELEISDVRLVQDADATSGVPSRSATVSHNVTINVLAAPNSAVQIRIGNDTFPLTNLSVAVANRLAGDPQACFIIRADKSVPYDAITAVLDILRGAHASQVFFATSREGMLESAHAIEPDFSSIASGGPIDWRSFIFGGLAMLGALCGLVASFILARRVRHFRHARELRRIASLDG